MIIFGIYNIKGGVGKTAAAVNLSYLSSLDGQKTLLWDLDPQGSASFYYHKEKGNDASLKKIITGKIKLQDIIVDTDYRKLKIIPSDFSYRHMDTILDQVKKSKKRIREVLKEMKDDFDIVFLDCPPGISVLAENIFHACDYVLVPTVPTPLSLRTYEQIKSFFEEDGQDKSSVIPFFSMVEMRKSIHQNIIKELNGKMPNLCTSTIPFLADIEKMGIYRKPLADFIPNSKAAASFKALWKEIKKKTINK
ncbi:MAG: ParA family protein [Bacteroidota bacterium]